MSRSPSTAKAASLGVGSLSCLVIASMIGAGVFTTSGFAMADLGTPGRVLAAWFIGGGVAMLGALSYGALAHQMAESGGEYLFLSRAVHPAAGFVAGWISLLAGFTGAIAFAATTFESYALPEGARPGWLPPGSLAVGLVIVCGLLHGFRVKPGVRAQNIEVALKLLLLLAFMGVALWHLGTTRWQGGPLVNAEGVTPPFDLSAFTMSLLWISLSYSGFNAAIYVASEARTPARSVPRAMLIGTLGVTVIYLILNTLFVAAPPPASIAGRADVAAAAAVEIGGDGLARIVRLAICLALVTSVSAMVMTGPRVYAKMADDGLFPRAFGAQAAAPGRAVLLQVVLAVVVVLLSSLQELLSYLGFTLSLSAAVTVASIFLLKRRPATRSMPVPGYPIVPAAFVACTLGFAALAAYRRPWEAGAAVATIASGLLLYAIMRRVS